MENNEQFLATLPEDIRAEPSLKTIADVPTLAKSYVNAQKLIGTKRLPTPEASWGESQWNEFYDAAGRPKTPDLYPVPDVKLEDGLSLDKDRLTKFQQQAHKLGLNASQGRGVLEYYMNVMNETMQAQKSSTAQSAAAAEVELKQEWGDKFDANVDLAKGVIRKFGDEKIMSYIEGGMGNNTQLVRLLSKIGSLMIEDKAKGGGAEFGIKDSTRAITEIDTLKADTDFMAALMKHEHPGHRGAVDRWTRLHAVAYPGKQVE